MDSHIVKKRVSRHFLMFNCLLCLGASFSTKHLLKQHCKGKSHLRNLDTAGTINESEAAVTINESEAAQEAEHAFNCPLCPGASFDSELALNRHSKGKRHLQIRTAFECSSSYICKAFVISLSKSSEGEGSAGEASISSSTSTSTSISAILAQVGLEGSNSIAKLYLKQNNMPS